MEKKEFKFLTELRNDLDELDSKRELILKETRIIIRLCSEIIKRIQREDFDNIEVRLIQIEKSIKDLQQSAEILSVNIGKNYLIDVKQEYIEAKLFYKLIKEKRILGFKEMEVYPYEYIMGLADLIGELKRYILNCIRKNKMKDAELYFEIMEDLYDNLVLLDYPEGLIQGFRHKLDKCRDILNKTQEIITLSLKEHK